MVGVCLSIKWSGFNPWLGALRSILRQDTLTVPLPKQVYKWALSHPVNRLPASMNEAREPVDILLMLPIHYTRIWYHDLIGSIADC